MWKRTSSEFIEEIRRIGWKEDKINAGRRKCHNCFLYFPHPASCISYCYLISQVPTFHIQPFFLSSPTFTSASQLSNILLLCFSNWNTFSLCVPFHLHLYSIKAQSLKLFGFEAQLCHFLTLTSPLTSSFTICKMGTIASVSYFSMKTKEFM